MRDLAGHAHFLAVLPRSAERHKSDGPQRVSEICRRRITPEFTRGTPAARFAGLVGSSDERLSRRRPSGEGCMALGVDWQPQGI